MKALRKTVSIILLTIMGIVLLAAGILLVLYSPWGQNAMRTHVLSVLNSKPGLEVKLDKFSLAFPLALDIEGLSLVQDGDTMIAASSAQVGVKLIPLLKKEIEVDELQLMHARYQMGNADSLTQMLITADTISLKPVNVKLSPITIDLENGFISHGLFLMKSLPDTMPKPQAAESTDMSIKIGNLALRDFTFQMSLLPTIDSLGTNIGTGEVVGGDIDLKQQLVKIKQFTGTRLNAAYIAADSAQIASTPEAPPADTTTPPWTVEIDSIHFTDSKGLYTTKGYEPMPGLDFGYIEADSMELTVTNLYNQATILSLPIKLQATERCGVRLDANGTFAMDSAAMYIRNFEIDMPDSRLHVDGMLGVGDMLTDPDLPLRLVGSGEIGFPDLRLMFPAFKPYLAGFSASTPIDLVANLNGTAGDFDIKTLNIKINHCAWLKASGKVKDAFSAKGPSGNLRLDGRIFSADNLVKNFAPDAGFTIPPMTLDGKVSMYAGLIKGNLNATAHDGRVTLDAQYNSNKEGYKIDLTTDKFPVNAFMPDLGVGQATIDLKAQGQGFDLLSPKTRLKAKGSVKSLYYQGYNYHSINMFADVDRGKAEMQISSENENVNAIVNVDGNLVGDNYHWDVVIEGHYIDLYKLKITQEPAYLSTDIDMETTFTTDLKNISATLHINNLIYGDDLTSYTFSNIKTRFESSDSLTTVTLTNRDFLATASMPYGLDTISVRMDRSMAELDRQIQNKALQIDTLQMMLPQFSAYISAGNNNFINDILAASKMTMRRFNLTAANDSSLHLDAKMLRFITPSLRFDTITVDIAQKVDKIQLNAAVNNKPGSFDNFAHVDLNCLLNNNKIALRATQRNIQNATGFDFGAFASFSDSTVTARLFPLNPIIGYKKWNVNLDNYITYDFPHKIIDANLKMKGDRSSVTLYTDNTTDSISGQTDNDVVLQIGDIQIADWIAINPFAPPIDGSLSANMHLNWDGGENINGKGYVELGDFMYNRQRVGTFLSNLDVTTNTSGSIRASADLSVDGRQAMTLSGALNDSIAKSPFNMDLKVIRFPLDIANPFFPPDVAKLSGTLNGTMDVKGDAAKPIINGEIYFDSTAIKLAMTGTSFRVSDVKIPVINNLVSFNNFGLYGANNNPLTLNGTVKMMPITSPSFDLQLSAENMLAFDTNSAPRGAQVFGKARIDMGAKVKGNMDYMSVDADMTIRSGTNVTYIMTETVSSLQNTSTTDMVKFVNFTDSLEVIQADTLSNTEMLMNINANLVIQGGTTFTVDLSSSARDKVVVMPTANLEYTQSPVSDGRLTGRININDGYARYTLPVIGSEKMFTFNPNSYIAFNGDILDPVLNVHATDVVKTNVTQEGQNSRLVNFDIDLGVTGTLSKMDVAFDLKTNDDITIANELQSMSPEQRANQAMNLLLYNMYTGPGTKASGNLSINPLYSFLESQVNNWAANNIKGVDLSFGIDQYNQTTNGSSQVTTNYSYQVSKSLFNDRFKIVVGGNYNTNENSDENLSENLISDISFVYYLNNARSMLVKLFRHTGYESILEGEITQTGVGFVYKRKVNNLVQVLPRFMRPKKYKDIEQ